MDEQEFWSIISMLDWSQTGDDDAVLEAAVQCLAGKSDEEIGEFYEIFARLLYEIDGKAWAEKIAAPPKAGDLNFDSPDSFLYARCCVVANGKAAYYKVREDPQQMPRHMEFEALLYLCDRAWERKHGSDADYEDFYHETEYNFESFSNEEQW